MNKQTICIDFDGVIHDYKEGWKDGTVYGELTPGFIDWAAKMKEHYVLAIFSSRSKNSQTRSAMMNWLFEQLEKHQHEDPSWWSVGYNDFEFPSEKPPAVVYIDDRALRFDGNWSSGDLTPEAIRSFKPWMKR